MNFKKENFLRILYGRINTNLYVNSIWKIIMDSPFYIKIIGYTAENTGTN